MKQQLARLIRVKCTLGILHTLNFAMDTSNWVFDEVYFISETFRIHRMTDGCVRIEEGVLNWLESRAIRCTAWLDEGQFNA